MRRTKRMRNYGVLAVLIACCGFGCRQEYSVEHVRSFDFSTHLLPEHQGWNGDMRGTAIEGPTFEQAGLRSDTLGFPVSEHGHQWWWEATPSTPWDPCVMTDKIGWWNHEDAYTGTGAFMEVEIKVVSSGVSDDGETIRTGWSGAFGDYWQTFGLGLFDDGYILRNDVLSSSATPMRWFETTDDFHVYRLVADGAGGHLFIDGLYMETVEYGDELGPALGYAFANFGDSQGLRSDTIVRNFAYGCYPDQLPPIAMDDQAARRGFDVIEVDVLINDTDPEGEPLTVVAVTNGQYGDVGFDVETGRITYTPWFADTIADVFTYTVIDGMGGASTASVSVELGTEAVRGDLDDDGDGDVLWHNPVTGGVIAWTMAQGVKESGAFLGHTDAGPGHDIEGRIGDFDGDGDSDVMWRNFAGDGGNKLWTIDDAMVSETSWLGESETTRDYLAIGDFDDDGHDDMFWRESSTGNNLLWFMKQGVKEFGTWWGYYDESREVLISGDFDGDGDDDLILRDFDHGTGETVLWEMEDGVKISATWLGAIRPDDDMVIVGNFDGDDDDDLIWRDSVTGGTLLWTMQDGAQESGHWLGYYDPNKDEVLAGDFDGDGVDDLMWRDSQDGGLVLWTMQNGEKDTGEWLGYHHVGYNMVGAVRAHVE